jgi:hypothetical protein
MTEKPLLDGFMECAIPRPGFFLFVVSLSEPIERPQATGFTELSAKKIINTALDCLAATRPHTDKFDIGVYGYHRTPSGLALKWLLPTPEPAKSAVLKFEDIGNLRVERECSEIADVLESESIAEQASVLAWAHRNLIGWAEMHPDGYPPVLIHCAATIQQDRRIAGIVRSIRTLAVLSGNVRVLQWAIGGGSSNDSAFLDSVAKAVDFELPKTIAPRLSPSAFEVVREYWSPKRGNDRDMWEDAFAYDSSKSVAAVCDGTGAGIFCREWAARIARRFVDQGRGLGREVAIDKWLEPAIKEWSDNLPIPELKAIHHRKIAEIGAGTTLIGLELESRCDCPDDRFWHATAIGDSCLFHIRHKEWFSFPLVASKDFTNTPPVLRTKHGRVPTATFASGTCQEGDIFMLATDAVAAKMLADAESEPFDWERYAEMSPEEWVAEFDSLRETGMMVNDDCTLLILRVGSISPGATKEFNPTQDEVIHTMGDRSDVADA